MVYFAISKYIKEYETNKSNYLSQNKDFIDIDFIEHEIENYQINLKLINSNPLLAFCEFIDPLINDYPNDISLKNYIDDPYLSYGSNIFREYREQYSEIKEEVLKDNSKSKISSLKIIFLKIIEFLETKKNENKMNIKQKNNNEIKTLNWQGTQLEFTELVKALIASNKLNTELTQKEVFNRLREFFNIVEFNENEKLNDIRKRTNTPTPFINILETSLNNWITRID